MFCIKVELNDGFIFFIGLTSNEGNILNAYKFETLGEANDYMHEFIDMLDDDVIDTIYEISIARI